MSRTTSAALFAAAAVVAALVVIPPSSAQEMFRPPDTILPGATLRAVLDEISGRIALDNEIAIAGYNRIRTPEEMTAPGFMFEADVLHKIMKGYGLDELTLESLTRPDRKTWWVGHDAELRMTRPEPRLLARLAEQPALLVRGSDAVDCEGELAFVDRRDVPKLKDTDFSGKIVLTSEYPGWVAPALEKGALGILSYENSIRPLDDPDQVMFDMSLTRGAAKGKVFAMRLSTRQGQELRDMLQRGPKVVVRAKVAAKEYPWKADTVFAAIRGTAPEKKGLMFTAHLFERPAKIGANDNVSGCVVLAEIARTLSAMVRDGRLPRPERSVYFLMSEEGSGTAAFFLAHPEMAGRILGDINMDMVGEDLDRNSASFCIEAPPYSKATYLDAVARSFAEYVYRTNIELHGVYTPDGGPFPVPIVEKDGSRQSFRYLVTPYSGGSDHGIFIDADSGIPALSFMVWPDKWYHTDHDTPDKTDPTQLKRVAFIGAGSALAVCGGGDGTLERLARTAWLDRREFVGRAYARAVERVDARAAADGGRALRDGLNDVAQSVKVSRSALSGIRELTAGRGAADAYLTGLMGDLEKLAPSYSDALRRYERLSTDARGWKAAPASAPASADDRAVAALVPVKSAPVPLGGFFPYTELLDAFRKNPEAQKVVFERLGFRGLVEMLMLADGTRTLAEIRDVIGFEFKPVESADVLKTARALESAKVIALKAAK